MSSLAFTVLFVGFLVLSIVIRFWLASRHVRRILAHRSARPDPINWAHSARSAPTCDRLHDRPDQVFGLFVILLNNAVLIGFTLIGGLQWLASTSLDIFGPSIRYYQLALMLAFALISCLIKLDSRSSSASTA